MEHCQNCGSCGNCSGCRHALLLSAGELALLQKKLQQEVDKENYEAAAVLRDQINALKKQCDEAAAAEPSERSVGGE